MTSFKSRLFNFLVKNRHFFTGKFKKEVFDMNTSIAGFRERCEKGARFARIPPEVTVKPEVIEWMGCEWLKPEQANPEKLILYVHGGGYVSGSCNDHRGFVSKFARYTGVTSLIYEYRLAPEHPFPSALDDSVTIYRWLLSSGFKPENLVIAGESAGGGLCLALLLALKEQNIPMPSAAVAISPWTDLTCSSDSYISKNRYSPAPQDSWLVFSRYYAGNQPTTLPLISPLYGDLKGLPPIFINSAENDELYDEGKKFAYKAKEAGVDVTFRVGTGMIHCYPLLAPMFPEATTALEEIAEFVRKCLILS
jgi:monoterpene epsilon-lactone hydrolase